ncbi:TOBE domain-containing protein [Paraburkholderia sp. BR13444]|uniref:TOBE domain-containing protein n=1 Tax=Paraburkholderia sp. BR13444 TaxID=3236997 RepID=UPI0034CDDE65
MPAEVVVVEPTGSETQIAARFAGQDLIVAYRGRIDARPGDRIHLLPRTERTHLFDAHSGARLN